jgi:hypothetical protein
VLGPRHLHGLHSIIAQPLAPTACRSSRAMRWTVSLPVPSALAVARMPSLLPSISTIRARFAAVIRGRPSLIP